MQMKQRRKNVVGFAPSAFSREMPPCIYGSAPPPLADVDAFAEGLAFTDARDELPPALLTGLSRATGLHRNNKQSQEKINEMNVAVLCQRRDSMLGKSSRKIEEKRREVEAEAEAERARESERERERERWREKGNDRYGR